MELFLHGRYRHYPLVRVVEMNARLFRLHRFSFQQNNACDDLQAIGDPMLKLFEQYVFPTFG
jgi:hypothetical protein